MRVSLGIIIVNWNAGEQLRDCLESIVAAGPDGFDLNRVIVVDNNSSDGSINGLENVPLPLTVIRNTENLGFAAACNRAAKETETDYLLFLNPDTLLFENSLTESLAHIEDPGNRRIGIVGIQLVDDRGRIQRTCARFPRPSRFFCRMLGLDRLFGGVFKSHVMAEWDHTESRDVDHVMGAFFLVRRSLFDDLFGFDERFFVYLEDLDFSYRAMQAGWRTSYLAAAQAYHKGGGTSEQVKAVRLFYSLRSRILYGYKHFGWWPATALMLGTLFLEPVTRIMHAVLKGSLGQVRDTLKGYAMLWASLPH
jgi:GT2 family glycosyltransferase